MNEARADLKTVKAELNYSLNDLEKTRVEAETASAAAAHFSKAAAEAAENAAKHAAALDPEVARASEAEAKARAAEARLASVTEAIQTPPARKPAEVKAQMSLVAAEREGISASAARIQSAAS